MIVTSRIRTEELFTISPSQLEFEFLVKMTMSTQNTLFMLVIGAVLFFFSGFALKHVVGPTCTGGGTETTGELADLQSTIKAKDLKISGLTTDLAAAKAAAGATTAVVPPAAANPAVVADAAADN
eukprot:884799_1